MFDLQLLGIVVATVAGSALLGAAAPECLRGGGAGKPLMGAHRGGAGVVASVGTLLRVLCSLGCAFVASVAAAAVLPMADAPLEQLPTVAFATGVAFVLTVAAARLLRGPLEAVLADAAVSEVDSDPTAWKRAQAAAL